MDGISALRVPGWLGTDIKKHPAYYAGNALGWLYRGCKQAATNQPLSGRLYLAKSGWLLLSVPNALVRGVYDALTAPGAELPLPGALNVPNVADDVLNAHISVMTADEVKKIGQDNINERGHMFGYALGQLKEISPRNIDGISKVWAIQVSAPALTALRKSYGLSPLPNGDHPFHITVAVRRKGVLQGNNVSKAASIAEIKHSNALSCSGQKDLLTSGKADNLPGRDFFADNLTKGASYEREHTNNDQVAKKIAANYLQKKPVCYKKQEKIASGSVYVNAALNAAPHMLRKPIQYNHDKPVFENIGNQLSAMKRRGDFLMQTRRNHEMYVSALDPKYRHQRMIQAFRGQLPQANVTDQLIEQYGNNAISQITGRR